MNMDENSEIYEEPITFDDILTDKEYQAEFDRRVAKALETGKAKWQKEYEAKVQEEKNEAEKLAKMSESEKFKHEMEKVSAERDEAKAKLSAYELRAQAQKMALEKGMDVGLLDIIDFSRETADSIKSKVDVIFNSVSKATEKQLSERLKQPEPRNVAVGDKVKKTVSRASI